MVIIFCWYNFCINLNLLNKKLSLTEWKFCKAFCVCLPRMGSNLVVKVHYRLGSGQSVGKATWEYLIAIILHRSLTNEYPVSVGYDDILNWYKALHSNYWTNMYGIVRMVVWEVGYSIIYHYIESNSLLQQTHSTRL